MNWFAKQPPERTRMTPVLRLEGAALAWAVAKSFDKWADDVYIARFGPLFGKGYLWPAMQLSKFNPMEGNFILALMERRKISLVRKDDAWCAKLGDLSASHQDQAIAVLRVSVMRSFGDGVDIPERLLAWPNI